MAGQTHGPASLPCVAQRQPAAEDGADHVLPSAPMFQRFGPEAIGQADGDERERRRLDDELLERPRVAQRPADVNPEGGERRAAHEPDHNPPAMRKGDQEGGNRRDDAGDARHLGARRELKPHAALCAGATPIISSPISSRVHDAVGRAGPSSPGADDRDAVGDLEELVEILADDEDPRRPRREDRSAPAG